MSNNDAKDRTIYAKIDTTIADNLKAIADSSGKSQAAFLAEIINYFSRLYEAAREAATTRGATEADARKIAARNLEKQIASDHNEIQEWVSTLESEDMRLQSIASTIAFFTGKNASAEHSFTRGWYEWTIESYTEIIKKFDRLTEYETKELKEARTLAIFRLGFCWSRMAQRLRKECLESYIKESRLSALVDGYAAAMKAAAYAAAYFREMNSNLSVEDRESPVG